MDNSVDAGILWFRTELWTLTAPKSCGGLQLQSYCPGCIRLRRLGDSAGRSLRPMWPITLTGNALNVCIAVARRGSPVRYIIFASLLAISVVYSALQYARLRRYRSGAAFMPSSAHAFSLMKRSFAALWFACASLLALVLQWDTASMFLCLLAGILVAFGLELLARSCGLMIFIEAGEEAMEQRRMAIRRSVSAGQLFVVQPRGAEAISKIVPRRPDWDALLQYRAGQVRTTAS